MRWQLGRSYVLWLQAYATLRIALSELHGALNQLKIDYA